MLTTCASRALPGVLAQAPTELTRSILSPICPPRAPHLPWRPEALQGGALSPVSPHVYETRRAHVIRPGGEKGTTKREAVWLDARASTGREDTGGTGQRCDLLSLLLTALSTFSSRTARKAPVGPEEVVRTVVCGPCSGGPAVRRHTRVQRSESRTIGACATVYVQTAHASRVDAQTSSSAVDWS